MEELKALILGPVNATWDRLAVFLLKFLSVIVILLVGWVVAKIIRTVVVRALKLARLDTVSEKSGIANVLLKGDINQTLSEIIGTIVYWTMMLIVILMAVDVFKLDVAATLLNSVILYIPNVVAAMFILVLGIFFASVLATMVRTTAANSGVAQAKGLGRLTQVIIIIFTVIQALDQLQIGVTVLTMLVQATVGCLALGLAIAIGLGCKDIVAKQAQNLVDSFRSK